MAVVIGVIGVIGVVVVVVLGFLVVWSYKKELQGAFILYSSTEMYTACTHG